MASRLLDPVALEGVVTTLERLAETLATRHRALTAALALADRPIGSVDLLVGTADEAKCWASVLRERIGWADGHDPFADSDHMVDGLAVPRAAVGDVGGNGSASGWEVPGVSAMWQPWRSFGQHARQAISQRGLEWPDNRPELTTVLAPVGSLLAEVSGIADAKRCLHRSFSACGWFMAGLVPWGRLARLARLARFADETVETGADLARAESATDALRLARSLAAREIGSGHAYRKHVVERGEFPWITSQEDFVQHIERSWRLGSVEA